MCSAFILMHDSCYVDNFDRISEMFARGIGYGIFLGTVVGVLLLFTKYIKD